MLLFKRHLVELIRRGQKRQTVRLWSRPLLQKGQISYTPGLGKMKITAVDLLPSLAALTEADAIADGFPSLATLLAEIHKIYGKPLPPNRQLYRIRFSWPIDAAGRTLVLQQKPEARSQKPEEKKRKSKIKNQKSLPSPLSPAQRRQALRSYVLAFFARKTP